MGSGGSPSYAPVNLSTLQNLVSGQSLSNLTGSQALQQQYNPQLWAAQQGAQGNLAASTGTASSQMGAAAQGNQALQGILGYMPQNVNLSPLGANPVQTSTNNAINQQLQNPGGLSFDSKNQTLNQALSQGGQSGIINGASQTALGNLDLGQASLAQYNQNLGLGNQAAQQQQALNVQQQQAQANLGQQNNSLSLQGLGLLPGQSQALSSYYNSALTPSYSALGLGLPQSGLDPGALGSAYVSNLNAYNASQQQAAANSAQQGNSLLGLGGSLASAGILAAALA
jgi:hypothetical protein